MGRKVLFSAILAAGLTQMAPAIAQLHDQPQDAGGPAPAPATPIEAAAPPAPAPAAQAEAAAQPAAAIKVAEEAPRAAAPVTDAGAREPDLADKDLAAVPPEEAKPVLVDPTAARRGLASAGRSTLPPPRMAPRDAAPALAAAEPEASRVPAPRASHPEVVQAERVVAAAQNRVDGKPAPEPAIASRDTAPPAEEPRRDPEPVLAAAEPVPDAVDAEVGGDTALARAARAAASRPAPAIEDHRPRPVYAGDERSMRSGHLDDEREAGLLHANDDRDLRPAYPQGRREARRGYGDRDFDVDPRYSMADRGFRPGILRGDRGWVDRGGERGCDDGRAYRLQQRLRRDVRDGVIDWRAAQDIEEDIGHVDYMHRSYCVSGMTDWREERLDREYAQIEDRLRFEEDFNRRD